MKNFRKIISKTLRVIRIVSLVFFVLLSIFVYIAMYFDYEFIDNLLTFIHYPWSFNTFWYISGATLAILIGSHILIKKFFDYEY